MQPKWAKSNFKWEKGRFSLLFAMHVNHLHNFEDAHKIRAGTPKIQMSLVSLITPSVDISPFAVNIEVSSFS